MKYDIDESMQEISKRSKALRGKRNRQINRTLYSAAGALAIALIGAVYGIVGPSLPGQGKSAYGSALLSAEVGGYVIVAILAFAFGVVLTLVLTRRRARYQKDIISKSNVGK